jgi:hypothetical protein
MTAGTRAGERQGVTETPSFIEPVFFRVLLAREGHGKGRPGDEPQEGVREHRRSYRSGLRKRQPRLGDIFPGMGNAPLPSIVTVRATKVVVALGVVVLDVLANRAAQAPPATWNDVP